MRKIFSGEYAFCLLLLITVVAFGLSLAYSARNVASRAVAMDESLMVVKNTSAAIDAGISSADFEKADDRGWTPLHYAIFVSTHTDSVKSEIGKSVASKLFDLGVPFSNVTQQDFGGIPTHTTPWEFTAIARDIVRERDQALNKDPASGFFSFMLGYSMGTASGLAR